MKTIFGVTGVTVTLVITAVAFILTQRTERQTPIILQDEIGANLVQDKASSQNEYKIWRPDEASLSEKNGFTEGWEGDIQKSYIEATPSKKTEGASENQNPLKAQPMTKQQKKIEYFTLGTHTDTREENTVEQPEKPKEDQVHATIRAFGNEVGKKIQGFVISHSKQPERLNDFVMTRTEEGRTYVDRLASDYDSLADDVLNTKGPASFSDELAGLSKGYHAIADGLRILKKSTDDASAYENMLTYNAQVEEFGANFISFALLFKAQGVTFSENEPGGIFTPPVMSQ